MAERELNIVERTDGAHFVGGIFDHYIPNFGIFAFRNKQSFGGVNAVVFTLEF
ncbi:Uncharacterised protein [Vibrio cholerae]|nr:Uncharacterised protein [Vibrio cholerae]CSH94061.1 Uncharacterised protein [Vibrio cholerae]CSI64087.1 Uncharacterised protein [Vibrio cholerae]